MRLKIEETLQLRDFIRLEDKVDEIGPQAVANLVGLHLTAIPQMIAANRHIYLKEEDDGVWYYWEVKPLLRGSATVKVA